jgi:hypothetical protein
MTNEEIDIRLKALSKYLPEHFERQKDSITATSRTRVDVELELLNMTMTAVFTMLGEIAKRLPIPPDKKHAPY